MSCLSIVNKPSLPQPAVHGENSSVEMPLRTVMVRKLTASKTFFPMGTNVMKTGCTQGPKKCTHFNCQGQCIATSGLSYSYLNNID